MNRQLLGPSPGRRRPDLGDDGGGRASRPRCGSVAACSASTTTIRSFWRRSWPRSTSSPMGGWRRRSGRVGCGRIRRSRHPDGSAGRAHRPAGRGRRARCAPIWHGRTARHRRATYVHVSRLRGHADARADADPPIMIGGGAPTVLRARGTAGRHRQLQLQQLGRQARLGQRRQRHGRAQTGARSNGSARAPATASTEPRAGDRRLLRRRHRRSRRARTAAMASRFGIAAGGAAGHPHALIGTRGLDLRDAAGSGARPSGISYITVAQRTPRGSSPPSSPASPAREQRRADRPPGRRRRRRPVRHRRRPAGLGLYAACFTDPCEFDFSGWRGRRRGPDAAEWAAKVRATNGNFETSHPAHLRQPRRGPRRRRCR